MNLHLHIHQDHVDMLEDKWETHNHCIQYNFQLSSKLCYSPMQFYIPHEEVLWQSMFEEK